MLLQALSEQDRKSWMSAMGGLEPVKTVRKRKGKKPTDSDAQELALQDTGPVTQAGFAFVQRLTAFVEKHLTDHEVSTTAALVCCWPMMAVCLTPRRN